jgi:D-alanyl-D-alanine carboxypeptidase-like protein
VTAFAGVGHADTPSPTPSGTTSPSPAPVSPTPTASGSPTPSAPPTTATAAPTPTVKAQQPQAEAEAEAPGLTLTVRSTYGSGTSFWSDIGSYAFRGTATGLADGSPISVYYRVGSGSWRGLVSGKTADGAFAVDKLVGSDGTYSFVATSGGAPGSAEAVVSNSVSVTVGNSRVVFNRPVSRIDALKDPRLSGSIVPSRSGVTINIQVLRSGRFENVASTRTDANGRFAMNLSHGRGSLAGYRVRAAYRVPNRAYSEVAKSHYFARVAVLNAVVTPTTAAEVAKTYHAGCPVGRSQLSTVRMNFYGADKKMHRGVMIVRKDLAGEIKYAFSRALSVRFPVSRMRNPNDYGGNDPTQMRADNSSGFNCRSVVGNPYRRSPHSYGIALDVNPRQNPYRDVTGKWWPENGTAYIDRTPRRGGMLNLDSTLTRALRNDGFFWGGLWSPGRDYQHFQY